MMRASVDGRVVADSSDIVMSGGYAYFPAGDVRLDWLEKAPKTERDLVCPHGVQFYDVVIEGQRYARAAWNYEAPLASMARTRDRFGFWQDMKVV